MHNGLKVDLIQNEEVREELVRFKRGMSPTHLLIAEWIVQNPGGTYSEMGDFFGYSVPWLCTLCNSDMFKAHIHSRIKDIQAVTTQDVPEKMRVLATLACDKMMEQLNKATVPEQVIDSFDKVMHRYGYAPNARTGMQPQGPQIGQQNNVFYLNREQFQAVQGRLIQSHAALPAPTPDKEDDGTPAPATVEQKV